MQYKKILATAPNTVELAAAPYELRIAAPTEVIVKNRLSHLSAGTELACIAGLEDWFKLPATPGYTAIGEVAEKGAAVPGLEVGDRVYTFGPHAEYFKIDISDRWHGICLKLPEGIDEAEAAFAHMAGIAFTAIRVAQLELGDTVAVAGLGAIGNLAAQLAQLQGAEVLGLDISPARLEIARGCGIRQVANSQGRSIPELVREFYGGGAEVFIEATGLPQVAEAGATALALYGQLILLGSPRRPYQTDLTGFLQRIHLWSHGAITVKGALEFTLPTHRTEFVKHSIERNSAIILRLIRDGRLKVGPLRSHLLHPSQAQQAYDGLREQPDVYFGVVFDWR
jgi:threonine dehydrogenase-like Zn-dependent dehydrogenase